MRIIPAIILLLFTSTVLIHAQIPDSLKYNSVSPEKFLELIKSDKKVVIIDVRMPFEFRKERIENALNIPAAKTGKKHKTPGDKESIVLVYCTMGFRARRSAPKYYDMGFRNIYNLDGGIEAWKKKGLPVIKKHSAGNSKDGG